MPQASGRDWVGPGVNEASVVVTGAGVAVAIMVSTAVGTCVTGGAAGCCVHPAANSRSTSTKKREKTHLVFIYTHLFEKYLSVMISEKKTGALICPLARGRFNAGWLVSDGALFHDGIDFIGVFLWNLDKGVGV